MESSRLSDGTKRFVNRRAALLTAAVAMCGVRRARGDTPLQFGLTPVFLTNDLDLLTRLKDYLEKRTGRAVQLVQRRTYEEITALLLSGQLDAAWICGYPFAQYRSALALVAVPLWRGKPEYQSYLIAPRGRNVQDIAGLRGDIHAFSDPNSNSGFLVTAALLAEMKLRPDQFFRQTVFTYGHRNVVRAVASGLAQSGSVDGYVWEVMSVIEPALTGATEVVRKSEKLGFPPVACLRTQKASPSVTLLHEALLGMAHDAEGQGVLELLQLDGFADEPEDIFDRIAAKMMLVRGLGA